MQLLGLALQLSAVLARGYTFGYTYIESDHNLNKVKILELQKPTHYTDKASYNYHHRERVIPSKLLKVFKSWL